jgi:hypothetical protein
MKDDFSYEILPPAHWVAQPSINFKSQLNLIVQQKLLTISIKESKNEISDII